jgi:hypothetical protein
MVEGEPLVWDGHHQQAARPEDPAPLFQRTDGAGHVLEHVVGDHEIQRSRGQRWEVLAVADDVRVLTARVRAIELLRREDVGIEHAGRVRQRRRLVQGADFHAASPQAIGKALSRASDRACGETSHQAESLLP